MVWGSKLVARGQNTWLGVVTRGRVGGGFVGGQNKQWGFEMCGGGSKGVVWGSKGEGVEMLGWGSR